MRKINQSEFMFVLDYHCQKAPNSSESMYLKSLLGEEDGYVVLVGELYTDEESIYSEDQYDQKSWLHVCDIDWTKYE